MVGGYRGTGMMNQRNQFGYPIQLADNFTCGRNYIMGDIFKYSGPYLYPFVIEYSLITAAVIYAMWRNIGKNPRYIFYSYFQMLIEYQCYLSVHF